jgi:tetratricopeptide (TPR) repeat protein
MATTLNIAKESLKGNWLFGTGLQTFTYEWSKFKPVSINYESFGNVDFKNVDLSYGPGLLPTLLITSGLVGVFLLIVLILSTLWLAFKGYRLVDSESKTSFLLASYVSIYVWAAFILLIPNPALLLVLFIAEAYKLTLYFKARGSGYRDITITEGSRGILVFAGLAVPTLALIVLVAGVVKNTAAFFFVVRAQTAFTQNQDAEAADANLLRALALNNSDLYHVLRADLALAQANVLVQSTTTDEKERTIRVKELVDMALSESQKALAKDSQNYQNYVAQARVYEARLVLGDAQGYQNAQSAYATARTYNPLNPDIPLYQAQLARAVGDATSTDRFVAEALQRKQDYLNAAFFYAQYLVERKQVDGAIQFLSQYGDYYYTNFGSSTPLRRESLSIIAHNIGLLHYEAKNYDLAVKSFVLALQYTPGYQDAALMLMLSEVRNGNRAEGLRIAKLLLEANPANENLKTVVSTLEKGGNIFSGEAAVSTSEATKKAKEIREDENQKKIPASTVKTPPKR